MKVQVDRVKLVAQEVLATIENDPKITHMTFEIVEHNRKKAISISSSKEPNVIVI